MIAALRILGQAAFLLLVFALIGYFSDSPAYVQHPPDQALIKLSFSHAAERKGECRRLTSEEIAKLAPNMRKAVQCPRERLPIHVELVLDGRTVYQAVLPPTGLSGDGPSRVYERFIVSPGRHQLVARLRDSARTSGFDYERAAEIELRPQQNFVVELQPEAGGFVFR